MEDVFIVLGLFAFITSIPLVAIITFHKRATMKLQVTLMEKEVELEAIKMERYSLETEKLRLELTNEQQKLNTMQQLSNNHSK